ncbi:macro domain-like protein [Karstenula rhodostoma CBS 690.94]|uniref:Macro domain-like protein n=1 Tax=Karstenula rhodostoma CBS 690.94 TaxID=1392251 RepID=A0A9P4PBF6_9PLEO|nr:macro domain-like protein [Karstenula rhodostoma CBS 690.94]
MSSMSAVLERTVRFLITESRNVRTRHLLQHLEHGDSSTQLQVLKQLLCIRSPHSRLPPNVLRDIHDILIHERSHRVLTPVSSIPCMGTFTREKGRPPVRIKIWKGDITTLAPGTTAITNAANSQMLGCFQPTHRCIDNVIHSWAGPRLRQECFEIASARQDQPDALPVGDAVTTQAYCLPCDYVIHTVGPQLERGSEPDDVERRQLSQCYYSVLDEADRLPETAEGKSVALCGISTGLFAFPAKLAASIAVDTVAAWFAHHPEATISDVVFVTYTEDDHEIYGTLLKKNRPTWTLSPSEPAKELALTSPTIEKACAWLAEADTVIVSAGAGLSAADGLDYTSRTLFRTHFPAFLQYDLERLYDVFGFVDWPSDRVKWGYFFTHLNVVRQWPQSQLYGRLLEWLNSYGDNAHVRTSNADGLFVANGWDEARLSTPQGQYHYFQCVANCTPDSYWPSRPFLDKALPLIDAATQSLKDDSAVPRCKNCGGDLFLCVRAANWFNERPYRAGEARWKKFERRVLNGGGGKTVVLELGVGMNTPGVLKWPNEDLVRQGNQQVKLVRLAVGEHAEVPWDLEEAQLATSIDGDISLSLPQILPSASQKH